jgi:phosphatidylglycerophosphate synthase
MANTISQHSFPQHSFVGSVTELASMNFKDARRVHTSFSAEFERRVLVWLADRMPGWVNSDHLTVLGLVSMAGAGLAYWAARWNKWMLLVAIACLFLNWLGDSLDGTLARVRRHQRPRYGFYVDHMCDIFASLFLLGGMGTSGYMSPLVAAGLLIGYYMLSIEVFLTTYTIGRFQLSFFKFGPTELRVVLAIGNLFLLFKPICHLFGHAFRLFDVGGVVGALGMIGITIFTALRNGRQLYREEPLPEQRVG